MPERESPNTPLSRAAREAAEQQKVLRETGPYLTMGIQLALTILIFFGIGWWIDKHFGSGSLWTAVLSGVGAVFGLVYFIVTVLRLEKTDEKRGSSS